MTLVDQIDFMKGLLSTREKTYPDLVKMKRKTQKECDESLALTLAVLKTLENAQAAGGVSEQAAKDLSGVERFRILEPTLRQVQTCARTHSLECIHCRSVADVLEEVMGFIDKK